MCEVTLGAVDLDAFDKYDSLTYFHPSETVRNLHEEIYSPGCKLFQANRLTRLITKQSDSDIKTQKIVQSTLRPMGSVSGEAGLDISWGGEHGTEVSGYVSGSASDDHGNTAEVTIEVNNDGSGNANISVTHEEE